MGNNRAYKIEYESKGVRVPEINRKRKQSLYKNFKDAEQSLLNDGWLREVDPVRGKVYYGHKHEPETIALIITLFD